MTELRHAGASTIPEAQAVLEGFLPRFDTRFRVPAALPGPAYRPLDPALPLASILSFRHPRTVARDNTVKYRWRTLQLLPGSGRTSYAGVQVEVVEARTASSPSSTRGSPSPRARHRRVPACCGRPVSGRPKTPTTSASPRGSAPGAHPGGSPCSLPPRGRRRLATAPPRDPRPGASSSVLPCPGNSPAGRRSSRRSSRVSRCGRPPDSSGSPATPSVPTSGPTVCLDARTASPHPPEGSGGTDKVAALLD